MNKIIDAIHTPVALWALISPYVIPYRYYPLVLLTYIFILGNWADTTNDCHLTRLSDKLKKKNKENDEQEKFIKRLLTDYIGIELTDFQINEGTFWITFINALIVFFKLHPKWTNGNLSPRFVLIFFAFTYLMSRTDYFNIDD